jgi:hypothetical protein
MKWTMLIAAGLVAAVVAAAAATAGNGDHKTREATLQAQVAKLKAQNKKLNDAFSPAGIKRQLEKVKASLDKYQAVAEAEAAGYTAESPCESPATDPVASWWGGAMGIHYVNDALLGKPIDAGHPAILTYAPGPGGTLELLAAEYFKPDADQNVATDDDRPSVFGRAFDGPMLGHAPGMPIHYDLHVWLWKHNPSGLFAPWNPTVSC